MSFWNRKEIDNTIIVNDDNSDDDNSDDDSYDDNQYPYEYIKTYFQRHHDSTSEVDKIIKCCENGDLTGAIETYNECKNNIVNNIDYMFNKILYTCCKNGNNDVATWACNMYYFRNYHNDFMNKACKNNNLQLIKFFYSIGFGIQYDDNNLLHLACKLGYLSIVQWLHKMKINIDKECFKNACVNGNLNIVSWIIDIRNCTNETSLQNGFHPNIDSIDIVDILANTCVNGHFDIATFLYNIWKSDIDIRYEKDWIFKSACEYKNKQFATDIYHVGFNKYNMSHEIKKRNYKTLSILCKTNQTDIIDWFYNFCAEMGNPINITKCSKCFIELCNDLCYDTIRWFCKIDETILIESLKKINIEILSFLDLPHATMYLLIHCAKTKFEPVFNIDMVNEIDHISLRALFYHREYEILEQLQYKFSSVTLEYSDDPGDLDGPIIGYRFDENIVKSARKV